MVRQTEFTRNLRDEVLAIGRGGRIGTKRQTDVKGDNWR